MDWALLFMSIIWFCGAWYFLKISYDEDRLGMAFSYAVIFGLGACGFLVGSVMNA
jgi:multidrug transporter EmrE-like cation transporter